MMEVESKQPYCKHIYTLLDNSEVRLETCKEEYGIPKSSYVKNKDFKQNILKFFEENRNKYEHIEFGVNYFKGEMRKMLKDVENDIMDSDNLLKPKSLTFRGRFMYLYPGDEHILTNFIRIIDPSLEVLTLDLAGNYLNVLCLSKIMNEINNSHPFLVDIYVSLEMNSNTEYGSESEAMKNEGLLSVLRMTHLEKLSFNLVKAKHSEYFFMGMHKTTFTNHTLKLLDLELKSDSVFNASCLAKIFDVCVCLESLSVDFEKTSVSNVDTFLKRLSLSTIQKLRFSLENGEMNITVNELMKILCQSQSIISMNLNLRSVAKNNKDLHHMFDYLPYCKTLAHLRVQIQYCNASNENFYAFAEALKNTKVRLIDFHLDCTNQLSQPIMSEPALEMGKAVLGLPYLLFPSLRYSTSKKQNFESQSLRDYQKDARRAVYSIVASNKLVNNLMVYNPTFIYQDLFY